MADSSKLFYEQGRNETLDELRNRLANEIEVEYALFEEDDIHYVRWDRIESIIDEMYIDDN